MKPRRQRRSAEDAREAILDAAERRLAKSGPGSIRLQEVAADVGVSHPAILHHFGNREGLVQAVVERALEKLEEDLVHGLEQATADEVDTAAFLNRGFETLAERGHARLLAWLVLSGHAPPTSDRARKNWAQIAAAVHAKRLENGPPGAEPTREDTLFTVVLAALTLFGEAIAGTGVFRAAGLDGAPTEARFREWFAALLVAHLEGRCDRD